MSAGPKVLGTCKCPLPWCAEDGAEVREDTRGVPYIICDACNSMVRTQSRKGKAGMRALVPAAVPAGGAKDDPPAAVPAAAKPEAKRRRFGFA